MPEAEAAFPFRCAQFSTENAAEKCSFYIFAFFTVCRTLIFVTAKSFLTHTHTDALGFVRHSFWLGQPGARRAGEFCWSESKQNCALTAMERKAENLHRQTRIFMFVCNLWFVNELRRFCYLRKFSLAQSSSKRHTHTPFHGRNADLNASHSFYT